MKQVLAKWQIELHNTGWNSLFWNNHDLPRIVSRWGDDGIYRVQSAKMLATLLYGLQGTPYIYQGEELGMTNVRYPIEEYRDIETLNLYRERIAQGFPESSVLASIYAKGRDNARTPMQWSADENAGFSTAKPWIKVNPNYPEINVRRQLADPESVFHYYRKLISLRKRYPVFLDGSFTLLCPDSPDIFAYKRENGKEQLYVVCNFSAQEADFVLETDFSAMQCLISNYPEQALPEKLRPYEAFMYFLTKNKTN